MPKTVAFIFHHYPALSYDNQQLECWPFIYFFFSPLLFQSSPGDYFSVSSEILAS